MKNSMFLQAQERFNTLGFPTKKDEHWRFADFNFWSNPELLKDLTPFEDFNLDENSRKFFETLLSGGKFDAYLAANFGNLNVVKIAKFEKSVFSGKYKSNINMFVLEEGAELEILCENSEDLAGLNLQANCFVLAKNSTLKINTLNTANAAAYSRSDFFLADGATVGDVYVELGKSPTRTERNFNILGQHAKADSALLLKSCGEITHDARTNQMHYCGKSHSNVLVKSILDDASKLAFMGLIRVEEGAQQTESYQSCRSMLLAKKAKAQASPILEIMANDVICSHGCAVARPDEEQIFYMKSRGLDEKEAQKLLIGGFANEVLDRISNPEFKAKAELNLHAF